MNLWFKFCGIVGFIGRVRVSVSLGKYHSDIDIDVHVDEDIGIGAGAADVGVGVGRGRHTYGYTYIKCILYAKRYIKLDINCSYVLLSRTIMTNSHFKLNVH